MQKMPFLRFLKLEIGLEKVQPESSKKEKKTKICYKTYILFLCNSKNCCNFVARIKIPLFHG